MSNEIEMYVQDKEGTKNEIHFIINNVICWGKRCTLNTKEQLLNAGFEIHLPNECDCEDCDECDKDLIEDYKKTHEIENEETKDEANAKGEADAKIAEEEEGIREQKEEDETFSDEVDPKFLESIKNDVALNEEIPENKEEEDEEYDEDKEIEAQKQQEYLSRHI